MGHHAVEGGKILKRVAPGTALVADPHMRPTPLGETVGTAKQFAGPDAFSLDLRIARELGCGVRQRQSEIDRVAVVFAGKSQP